MAKKNSLKSLTKGYTLRVFTRKDGSTYEKLQYAFRLDDGRRVFVYGDTREECEEKAELRKEKERNKNKTYTPNEELTIGQYFDELIAKSLHANLIRQSTAHTKTTMFNNRIRPVLGNKRIVDVQKREIEQLQLSLSDSLSTSGVNMTIALLRELFSKAVVDRIITENPMDGVLTYQRSEDETLVQNSTHRALTNSEIAIFTEASQGTHYHNLFMFLRYSGVRIGEAGALRLCDIDFKNGLININKTLSRVSNIECIVTKPKTKAGQRVISLTDELRKIINDQIRQNEILFGRSTALNGLLFRSTNGAEINEARVNTCLQQIIRKINRKNKRLDRFCPHAFRATYISDAVRSGVDRTCLMRMIGHSDYRTTDRYYVHVDTEQIIKQTKLIRFA